MRSAVRSQGVYLYILRRLFHSQVDLQVFLVTEREDSSQYQSSCSNGGRTAPSKSSKRYMVDTQAIPKAKYRNQDDPVRTSRLSPKPLLSNLSKPTPSLRALSKSIPSPSTPSICASPTSANALTAHLTYPTTHATLTQSTSPLPFHRFLHTAPASTASPLTRPSSYAARHPRHCRNRSFR